MGTCCEKNSYYGGWACVMDIERQYHHRDIFTKWVDLAYNKLSGCELLVIA